MKKYVNGEYIELTAEEVAEIEAQQAELPTPEPTSKERLETLEAAFMEFVSEVLTNG